MNESQLVRTIKALIAKGDQAADKSEQFYIAAGQHLKTLKSEKLQGVTWEQYLEDNGLNLGRRRADELIQIADGRVGAVALRERKNIAVSRHRSALRNAEPPDRPECLPAETWVEPSRAVDIWEPDTEGHPYPPIARRQGLLNRAADAVRLAQFDDFAGLKVDEEMRRAVREAVNAWTRTLNAMEEVHEAA